MQTSEVQATPRQRAVFFAGAAVMLALWGWSLMPAIENWNNPNEDGFSLVPGFWASFTFLPLGLIALIGAISSRGKRYWRARNAVIIGGILVVLLIALQIFFLIANAE